MQSARTRWLVPGLAVVMLAACAQGGPPGDRGPDDSGGPGGRGGRPGGPSQTAGGPGLGAMRSPDDARQYLMLQATRQLVDARQALRLTPAQLPAWDAYTASVAALIADLGRFESDPLNATSLQRMDRRVDRARNRYTALEGVADSMRALYAVLNEEQRVTADRVLAGTVPALYEGNPFGSPMDASSRPPDMSGQQQRRRGGGGDPPPR